MSCGTGEEVACARGVGGREGSSACFCLPSSRRGKWWWEAGSSSDAGQAPCPGAGRRELRRPVCVWREGGTSRPQVPVPGGPAGERTWQRRSRGRGIFFFAPRARINPPPPASGYVPGRLALHLPLRIIYPPTLLPPPPSRYFLSSWRLSDFPPLPRRDPPPPPSSEGIISPLLCRIIPPVPCPCLSFPSYAPPQPRLPGIICSPFGVIPSLLISAPAFPCLFSSRGSHPSPSVCL